MLAAAGLCCRLLEIGCKAAAEDRVGVMLLLDRAGATGTGGRGAV